MEQHMSDITETGFEIPETQPTDSSVLKKLLVDTCELEEEGWNTIVKLIEEENSIAQSIIFFYLDPQDALKLIPQSWIDSFPKGFLECWNKLSENLEYKNSRDLFRRMARTVVDGVSIVMTRDVNIDDYLEYTPDYMYDSLLESPTEVEKMIKFCEEHGQENTDGYSKLLLLK